MINSTYIIQYIEKMLGYHFNELEIDSEEILNNIKQDTLITYSKYFPYQKNILLNEADKVKGREGAYYINTKLKILGVSQVVTNNTAFTDPYLSVANIRQGSLDRFSMIQMADFSSMYNNPLTFSFEHPNVVVIQPTLIDASNTLVKINAVHPDNFSTIPYNMIDNFLELCVLDTKIVLYPIRHRFNNLNTVYGSIELFIDDLQDAADKKKDLIENWRKTSIRQTNRKKLFIY